MWGGGKGGNVCLVLGGGRWELSLQPRSVALPEGYTLNSQQAACSFGEYVGTHCVLCTRPGDK